MATTLASLRVPTRSGTSRFPRPGTGSGGPPGAGARVDEVATFEAPVDELERFRAELTGYCYRMLGSTFDADDAVQETMVRAWQAIDRFEGRSSLRSWVYRIATNVCMDSLRSKQRRALPMDLSAPVPSSTRPRRVRPETAWLQPIPDGDAIPGGSDPAERAALKDSIRLAFVAALQTVPPRQRAVLVLRDVLGWHANEVAELLDTSIASVNSALQRARSSLAAREATGHEGVSSLSEADKKLLARYAQAFESYDIAALVSLLREDASISMPPYEMWMQGRDNLTGWYLGHGIGCKGSRLIAVEANGMPAYGQYRPSEPGGRLEPWSIQVIELSGGGIAHVHHFLDTTLFERFGLPTALDS